MTKLLLPIAAFGIAATLLLSPAANAAADCNGAGNCNSTDDHSNTATGGTGVGVGVGIGKGGDATVSRSGNSSNDIDIRNSQAQAQGQEQSQRQEAKSSSYSGAISGSKSESEIKGSGNSDVSISYPRNTASANAPTVMLNACDRSISAGGQGPALGLALGFNFSDDDCVALTNARQLLQTADYFSKSGAQAKADQYYRAADRQMCSVEDIRDQNSGPGELCGPAPAPTVALDTQAIRNSLAQVSTMDPIKD